jgi:endonuclease III
VKKKFLENFGEIDYLCEMDILRDDLMVQQQVSNSWEHMIGVICLNQSHRVSVKRVLPEILKYFPTPQIMVSGPIEMLEHILEPCGMKRVKAKRIKRMSEDYLKWDGVDATKLYGIGKYGSDSYEIFYKKNYLTNPTDKELKRYLENMGK